MWKEFKAFVMRGNVVDLAVGVIVGTAFGAIANSLVKDVLMPPIGLLLGGVDFANLYILLKAGETPAPYASLADAQAAGAVMISYGVFPVIMAVEDVQMVHGIDEKISGENMIQGTEIYTEIVARLCGLEGAG